MASHTKTICRTRDKRLLRITAEIREDDPRGLSDGFSITAELYEPHGTWGGYTRAEHGLEPDAGGCLHDEILEFAPDLAPLITVHLAGLDGVPMHALANGWHFYSGKAREWEISRGYHPHGIDEITDRERAAGALHIPVADLPEGMDRDQFKVFVRSLQPVWERQADEARRVFEAMS